MTLALGVATMTTVFSVVDAELWKPLPFPDPQQLVAVFSRGPGVPGPVDAVSGAELLDWRAGTRALSDLAGAGPTSRRTLGLDAAESVRVQDVTSNYFDILARPAVEGRTFSPEGARGSLTAVVTDRAWRRLFDADPSIVGRSVALDERTIVIIGVVAADDSLGADPDLFLALDEGSPAFLDGTASVFYGAIGRLKPVMGANAARTELDAVAVRLTELDPERWTGHTMHVEDLREYSTGYNWRPLYFFLGAALVVLLLSMVSLASLLLARAFRRTREFALRGALGGGQGALARQLVVEGFLLAAPGGGIGVLLTMWAVTVFTAELPAEALVRGDSIPIDFRVYGFAFGVTALTVILCVLMPLLVARRIDLSRMLGRGGRTGRSATKGRARIMLLTAQIALTVVLLSGAGIFLKSFVSLTGIPLGFEASGTLAMRASLGGPRYATAAQVREYAENLLSQARAIPGVRSAGIGSSSPLGSGPLVNFVGRDQAPPALGEEPRAILRAASPGYFQTLGIRIVGGRDFSASDVTGAPRVAIVNEYLASQTFGGESPIGRVIELLPGARAPWTRPAGDLLVVGVVSNVKEVGLNEIEFADIYVPFAQMPAPSVEMVVRADVPPASLGDVLRQRAADVDPAVPVTSLSTFEQRLAGALQQDRFNLLLISSFAGIAVLLACIGVYGAVAYSVQASTRELGIRLALGAHPVRLVGAALWQAGRLGLLGGSLGLVGMLLIARAIGNALYLVPGAHNGLLYGVTTTDPGTLAGAFLGVIVVALVAGAIPARRVARVDPVLALRSE